MTRDRDKNIEANVKMKYVVWMCQLREMSRDRGVKAVKERKRVQIIK